MCASGWRMWHTNGFIYRFKRCEPSEYIFRIDFPELDVNGKVKEDWFLFINDCNISVACDRGTIVYLKKRSSDGLVEKFTDQKSRIRYEVKRNDYIVRNTGIMLVFAGLIAAHMLRITQIRYISIISYCALFIILICFLRLVIRQLKIMRRYTDMLIDESE